MPLALVLGQSRRDFVFTSLRDCPQKTITEQWATRDYGVYNDGDEFTPNQEMTVSLRDTVGMVVYE